MILLLTSFLVIISCLSSEAKTYKITKPTDLGGGKLVLEAGTRLVFMKSGCVMNGTVQGNNSIIVAKTKAPVFKNVKLEGSFKNDKAYLSWWNCDEDITDEIESLVTTFSGTVYLDRAGKMTKPIILNDKKTFKIDGCGNAFCLSNIGGFAFHLKQVNSIEVQNVSFKYVNSNPGTSSHVGALRIAHAGASDVKIHDVSIEGFDNSQYKPCGLDAIQIEGCKKGTVTLIHDVTVKDMVVKGDGKETNGIGANYAISVDCHEKESGKVNIYNCYISNLYNVDENGYKIYEDASGIYLGGAVGKNANGEMTYANWDAYIHDCHFKDVSKRNIKIQGNYVVLCNLYSETTEEFLKSYRNMYVGINGNYITIDGIYGQYDGCIVNISGNYLSLCNMDCTSALCNSKYAHVICLDGTQNAKIEDCKFDNDTYMFIYPTERNLTDASVPEFHIKRCSLNVKNLLYCITNFSIIYNKGVLMVDDSNISLSETYVSNSRSLSEIRLCGSTIRGKARMTIPKENGEPRVIVIESEIIEQ